MTAEENTIDGQDLSRLEHGDVPDADLLGVDDLLPTATHDLHGPVLALVVEVFELEFLLIIIDRTDEDDDSDGDEDGDTLDPVDLGLETAWRRAFGGLDVVVTGTESLVKTEGERDDRSDEKKNLEISKGLLRKRKYSPRPCP